MTMDEMYVSHLRLKFCSAKAFYFEARHAAEEFSTDRLMQQRKDALLHGCVEGSAQVIAKIDAEIRVVESRKQTAKEEANPLFVKMEEARSALVAALVAAARPKEPSRWEPSRWTKRDTLVAAVGSVLSVLYAVGLVLFLLRILGIIK